MDICCLDHGWCWQLRRGADGTVQSPSEDCAFGEEEVSTPLSPRHQRGIAVLSKDDPSKECKEAAKVNVRNRGGQGCHRHHQHQQRSQQQAHRSEKASVSSAWWPICKNSRFCRKVVVRRLYFVPARLPWLSDARVTNKPEC